MIRRSSAFVVAALLAGAGCGSNGGHGSSVGLAVAAAMSAATASGPDQTPPVVTLMTPARGAFLPAGPVPVSGRVTDLGSGVASVSVNGAPVSIDPTGFFATTVTLDEGVSPIVIRAIDHAGNRTERSLSVETGTYLPTTRPVSEAFTGRINASGFPVLARLGAVEIAAIQSTLPASLPAINPIVSFAGFNVSIDSVAFGTPSIAIGSLPQGIDLTIAIPQLAVGVDAQDASGTFKVNGAFNADLLTVHAVAQLAVGPSGALDVSFPTADVAVQNVSLTLPGALSWAAPLIQPLIANSIQTNVASLIQTQGAAKLQSILAQQATFSLLGTPATFAYAMHSVSCDATGLAFDVDADFALTPDPTFPVSPGSLVSAGGIPSSFSTTPTAVFSISQNAVNRALHAAWQSGLLSTVVAPSRFASSFGVALPFGQTAQDLVHFFPSLAAVVPAQYLASPIFFTFRSLLPPTASFVPGVPDPLRLRFGEYQVTASIDTGARPIDVYTVSLQAEIEVGVSIQNGALVPIMTTLPNPKVEVDLIDEPLAPLGKAHLESYLGAIVPMLFGGIATNLPPIQLPGLPAGAQLGNVSIRADGTGGTYLTVEADLR